MFFRHTFLSFLAFCTFGASISWSHPKGTSVIQITPKDSVLETLVDMNRDDVFYALSPAKAVEVMSPQEVRDLQDKIMFYVKNRLNMEVDGRQLTEANLKTWHMRRADSSLTPVDSVPLDSSTVVLTLSWPLPPEAKLLVFSTHLFPELVGISISDTRVWYRDTNIVREYLTSDDELWVFLSEDSLDSWYEQATTTSDPKPQRRLSNLSLSLLGLQHAAQSFDHLILVPLLLALFNFRWQALLALAVFWVAHLLGIAVQPLAGRLLSSEIGDGLLALLICVFSLGGLKSRDKYLKATLSLVIGLAVGGLVHGFCHGSQVQIFGSVVSLQGGVVHSTAALTAQLVFGGLLWFVFRFRNQTAGASSGLPAIVYGLSLAVGIYSLIRVFL